MAGAQVRRALVPDPARAVGFGDAVVAAVDDVALRSAGASGRGYGRLVYQVGSPRLYFFTAV